jgi:anti-anti-sigma factor
VVGGVVSLVPADRSWRAEEGGVVVDAATNDDRTTVRLVGEIDLATKPEVLGALDTAVARSRLDGHVVEVDLSEVSFIDATGVGCLVRALGALRQFDGGLVLTGARPNVRRVLELLDLDHLCSVAAEG